MTWRAARCLDVLIKQVNTAYPNRPKQSDGLIGDTAHASRISSHNPDAHGVVRGWDITAAPFCQKLAEQLAELGKTDQRVWYVIWNRRIASREHGFVWRPYDGTDPHTGHIHLSVSDDPGQYDRTDRWDVLDTVKAHTTAAPTPLGDRMLFLLSYNGKHYLTDGFQKKLVSPDSEKAYRAAGVTSINLPAAEVASMTGSK